MGLPISNKYVHIIEYPMTDVAFKCFCGWFASPCIRMMILCSLLTVFLQLFHLKFSIITLHSSIILPSGSPRGLLVVTLGAMFLNCFSNFIQRFSLNFFFKGKATSSDSIYMPTLICIYGETQTKQTDI